MRIGQRRVFETRKRLVGKTHHEQAHPAKDLRMAVGVDLVLAGSGKTAMQPDPQQEVMRPRRRLASARQEFRSEKTAGRWHRPMSKLGKLQLACAGLAR